MKNQVESKQQLNQLDLCEIVNRYFESDNALIMSDANGKNILFKIHITLALCSYFTFSTGRTKKSDIDAGF